MLFTIITASGTFYHVTQNDRHPGTQLPFNWYKKMLVVLGSGLGTSSLLKTPDTTHYNIMSRHLWDSWSLTFWRLLEGCHQPKEFPPFHTITPQEEPDAGRYRLAQGKVLWTVSFVSAVTIYLVLTSCVHQWCQYRKWQDTHGRWRL